MILDFATPQPINTLRIAWAEPYARRYVVQFWTGELDAALSHKGYMAGVPAGNRERQ